jgi:hypothetical protein
LNFLYFSLFAEPGIYANLKPDFVNSGEGEDDAVFVESVLTKAGTASFLDFTRAIAATRAGSPVFKPGVLESKPRRQTK